MRFHNEHICRVMKADVRNACAKQNFDQMETRSNKNAPNGTQISVLNSIMKGCGSQALIALGQQSGRFRPRLESSERRNIRTSRKTVTEHGSAKGDIAVGIIVKGLLDGRITFKVVMSQRSRWVGAQCPVHEEHQHGGLPSLGYG